MSSSFPPTPVYPNKTDSNFTLFHVHNTSEAPLSSDNNAYSDQIFVFPCDNDVWSNNGFINLSGELIYYDGTVRDGNGRVITFKRCLRGINGFSNFNPAGTVARGFVVAEQHNQMVLASILTEQFIGFNFTTDQTTLDWKIRNLAAQEFIPDDFACPEVQFDFEVTANTSTSTTISYNVIITGSYTSVVVSFGDGGTSTALTGVHTYSVTSTIDPVVSVTNGGCAITQTPIERTFITEPVPAAPTPIFSIPVPVTPALPSLIFPSFALPSLNLISPPNITPCIDLSPLNNLVNAFDNPSFIFGAISIEIPNVSVDVVVDILSFSPVTFAEPLSFSPVEFITPSFEPVSVVSPSWDSISVISPSFPMISIEIPSDIVMIDVSFLIPSGIISVDGELNVIFPSFPEIFVSPVSWPLVEFAPVSFAEIGFSEVSFPVVEFAPVSFAEIGFSEVSFPVVEFAPVSWPLVEFSPVRLPEVSFTSAGLPSIISLTNPGLPSVISLTNPGIPSVINFGANNVPTIISFGAAPTINFGTPPFVSIAWGSPPSISCQCSVVIVCPTTSSTTFSMFGRGMADYEPLANDVAVEYELGGIPSVISVVAPNIKVEHTIPTSIRIEPINVVIPDNFPYQISIIPLKQEEMFFSLIIPEFIELVPVNVPSVIEVKFPDHVPFLSIDKSTFPDSIRVEGMPSLISLVHNLPNNFGLDLVEGFKFPKLEVNMPPLEVKIDWSQNIAEKISSGETPLKCFAILPCS